MISRAVLSLFKNRQIIRRTSYSTVKRLFNDTTSKNNAIQIRNIHNTRLPKTPDLIYIPHVIRWLKTKFQFKYLQKTWDPEFTEGAFIYGTSKAVCRITEIIHEDKPEDLEGLLTPTTKIKLKEQMKAILTKSQKAIIKLKPEDIKILVPMNVCLKNEGLQKSCKIGMRVLALKWFQQKNGALRLVLVALQTEFLKDYKDGSYKLAKKRTPIQQPGKTWDPNFKRKNLKT
ncbi:unnamed protein product [Phaedon cochleariae]|uniref:Uncharacterized protein n=1 Tax=Phaedon cochleariae TaxID=80249 RepID=A0A9P0DK60_PHACE|nr:unnamed protein product [Phaedon cochleariae]